LQEGGFGDAKWWKHSELLEGNDRSGRQLESIGIRASNACSHYVLAINRPDVHIGSPVKPGVTNRPSTPIGQDQAVNTNGGSY